MIIGLDQQRITAAVYILNVGLRSGRGQSGFNADNGVDFGPSDLPK